VSKQEYIINPNLTFLTKAWSDKVNGVCLEGSSRSGKTYSIIQFLIALCSQKNGLVINIVRETYNSFKTTLYLDFAKILPEFGIKNPFGYVQDISTFNLLGNKINFLGTDKPDRLEGAGSDIFWCNEMLDINKVAFDQLEQRCRRFFIADWNPKTTDHWAFTLEKRADVRFLRTTYKDNLHWISPMELAKIESYEPTPENIQRGTADKFRWSVYGLGERAARHGLVHPDVTWIPEFPADGEVEKIGFGVDFGFTNSPTSVVKVGRKGNDLFVKVLYYGPTSDVNKVIEAIELTIPKGHHFTCDSAEPGIISDLRRAGFAAIPCKKFAGSVKYGIDLINRHRLFYVSNVDLRKEQENRVWKYVGGIPLNEPEAGNDHAHDALAYCLQTDFR